MNHDRTYHPIPHVPAPRLRDADGSMRQAPRRSAGHAATHPVPPLKGLPGTCATDVSYRASVPAGHAGRGVALSYRALAPGGAGLPSGIEGRRSDAAQPTAHYSLLTANSTYTFSAKEKDVETGLSYFGSRYYSSDLSVWLSVDPMAGKYPSLSPYTYCANNPVRVVDPNGEDYVVVVEGNTITIKAMYFVTIDTQKGVDEAIRNFKEQAPYLSYTSQDGKTYSVKFDLSIAKVFDTPEQAKQAKEENKGCGYANYCVSGETLVPHGSDLHALGQTLKGTDITIRTDRANDDYRTFIHEIGHTLGFGHWMFGVMGGAPGDTQIFDEYIQQSMYRAGFSETQSLSTSFNFSTDDMWKYVGKGKVIIKTKKR